MDLVPVFLGVGKAFEDNSAASFSADEAVGIRIECFAASIRRHHLVLA